MNFKQYLEDISSSDRCRQQNHSWDIPFWNALSVNKLSQVLACPRLYLDIPAGNAYCISNPDYLKFTLMLDMILLAIKSRSNIDHHNFPSHFFWIMQQNGNLYIQLFAWLPYECLHDWQVDFSTTSSSTCF